MFTQLSFLINIPFVLLLMMLATGPVLYAKFWHKYYALIAISLGALVVGYHIAILGELHEPIEALADYIQFIALISALYVTAGGILIHVNTPATSTSNLLLLWLGAILSNLIGTTGASMLLIRPFIRINKPHVEPYHMVFFIFMVSNIGGGLTPVGDPPLFLGFLKGVPFFWTLWNCFLPWFTALCLLSIIFYIIDQHHASQRAKIKPKSKTSRKTKMTIQGKGNFMLLFMIGIAVFLDPDIVNWIPSLEINHHHYSFVREIILIAIAMIAYFSADASLLRKNNFSFGPLREVVYIFFGLFGTMIPVLVLINDFAKSETGQNLINPHTLYWGVGSLSAFLDNAPIYLTSLKAGTASQGQSVIHFAKHTISYLRAISVAAVFFGAMSYIGNAPNYMVRKIAEESGIKMPSFLAYLTKFAIPFLLPILGLIWLLFFVAT
ncbi:MAG: sodium:proton antiporter [Bacteroidota bacterium]